MPAIHTAYVAPGSTYHPELPPLERMGAAPPAAGGHLSFHGGDRHGKSFAEYRYAKRNAEGVWENHTDGKAYGSSRRRRVSRRVSSSTSRRTWCLARAYPGKSDAGRGHRNALGAFTTFGIGFGKSDERTVMFDNPCTNPRERPPRVNVSADTNSPAHSPTIYS